MYDKLVSYAVNELGLDPENIKPDSNFETLGIDSLDVVEMIMELENEYGIEFDIENQNIASFKELADFIESKLN